MAIRMTNAAKDAILDSGFDAIFNSGTLVIYTGSQPASATASATDTVLATITLPADAFAASSSGSKAKSGTWQDASADGTGTAGWFRLKTSGDTNAATHTESRLDGSVGEGSGDLSLDNTDVNAGQAITINSFAVSL
jgi:hypothetical protein